MASSEWQMSGKILFAIRHSPFALFHSPLAP
jgi:hypothetical protein